MTKQITNPRNNLGSHNNVTPSAQEAIAALTKNVAKQIPNKVAEIRKCWEQLKDNPENNTDLQLLHRKAHTFAGTMGTYGFEKLADTAKEIELVLQAFIDDSSLEFPATELQSLLNRLEKNAKTASSNQLTQINTTPATLDSPTALSPSAPNNLNSKLIYLVDDDEDFLKNVEVQISNFGYDVQSFSTLASFDDALTNQEPGVVVMDVMFGEKTNGGIDHITQLNTQRSQPLRTIFMTGSNDLTTRLGAVRANGAAYFTKPALVEQLIDVLDRLTHQKKEEPFRIIIIDDSVEQSNFTALTLQQAGMETKEVNDPYELLEVLTEFPSDLILMDLYMPGCNGFELSQVIRQIDTYINIPIVFLSSEKNLGQKLSALSLGGDDFLSKPIKPWHLVSAVTNRVKRGRTIRQFAETDGLTGLLNHSKIKERLSIEVARAKRDASMLSFVMLDIDLFKNVNDKYGHPAGDRVLKSLANLLKQRLRSYDLIGRYGGEEFVIILPNTNLKEAQNLMNNLRIAFSEIEHYHESGNFKCQFSCGISSFPDFHNEIHLGNEADKALYQAKESGRNKVICIKN